MFLLVQYLYLLTLCSSPSHTNYTCTRAALAAFIHAATLCFRIQDFRIWQFIGHESTEHNSFWLVTFRSWDDGSWDKCGCLVVVIILLGLPVLVLWCWNKIFDNSRYLTSGAGGRMNSNSKFGSSHMFHFHFSKEFFKHEQRNLNYV